MHVDLTRPTHRFAVCRLHAFSTSHVSRASSAIYKIAFDQPYLHANISLPSNSSVDKFLDMRHDVFHLPSDVQRHEKPHRLPDLRVGFGQELNNVSPNQYMVCQMSAASKFRHFA